MAPLKSQDVSDLIKETGMRGFTPLAYLYEGACLGEDGTKELKDSILNDLAAWNILGSFIASIAFGGLLLGRVDNPKIPNFEWIFGSSIDSQISEWWIELCYSVCMTFSGFCGLRSVVAATLKYLYFNAIPHTAILPGIKLFRLKVYSQYNNSNRFLNCGAMLWDHTNSVMLSIQSLGAGFVAACTMIYGTQIAVFVAVLSFGLWRVIRNLHRQWEDAQYELNQLRPPFSEENDEVIDEKKTPPAINGLNNRRI